MKVELVTSREAFSRLAGPWNACLARSSRDHVYLRHEWIENLLDHEAADALHVVLVRDDRDELRGAFPGRRGTAHLRKLTLNATHLLANVYGHEAGVLADRGDDADDALRAVLDAAARSRDDWDVLVLPDLDDASGEVARFERTLTALGFRTTREQEQENVFLSCAGLAWDDYIEHHGPKRRSRLEKEERRLERRPGYEHRIQAAADGDLDRAIADYRAVYAKSWKPDEPHPDFHPRLARIAAERGWLRLGIVRLEGRPAAADFWLVYNGTASLLKTAYDPDFSAHSPGMLLMLKQMRGLLGEGLREIELGRGAHDWKLHWARERRRRTKLVVPNPRRPKGAFVLGADRWVKPLLGTPRGRV